MVRLISLSEITTICSVCCNHYFVLSFFMTYYHVCKVCVKTNATGGVMTGYSPGALDLTTGF
jgi:hypothetical protein